MLKTTATVKHLTTFCNFVRTFAWTGGHRSIVAQVVEWVV